MVMQRLHLDDAAGYVLQKEGSQWEHLNLPAIAPADQTYVFDTIHGPHTVHWQAGAALHEARESLAILRQLEIEMTPHEFSGQYLQHPVPVGGGLIKMDWLEQTYDKSAPLPRFSMVVQSWDTASKEHDGADYSVGITIRLHEKKYYVLDVVRRRMNFPDLKKALLAANAQYHPQAILIEDAASGIALAQELKDQGIYYVKPIRPVGTKHERLNAHTLKFSAGVVLFPQAAHWKKEFVLELMSFPTGRYDDQVDALTQGLNYLTEPQKGMGVFEFYRQEHEKRNKGG